MKIIIAYRSLARLLAPGLSESENSAAAGPSEGRYAPSGPSGWSVRLLLNHITIAWP